MRISLIFILFLALAISPIAAQQGFRSGILPKFNFNKKLPKNYSLNFAVESRQALWEGDFQQEIDMAYRYILTDVSLIGATKIGLNNKLAAGYLIRFEDGHIMHRIIQQFTFVTNLNNLRLGHRVSADQSFGSTFPLEIRLRYRLTAEFPLSGNEVDPMEFYVKINNEYLNSLEEGQYDFEVRVVPLLGFMFTDKNKLEAGFDYRLNSFLDGGSEQRLWFAVTWYVKL